MTFKVGQWVVVDTSVSYWPIQSKNDSGPFRIFNIETGFNGPYAVFNGAPNNAYFKHIKLYVPQEGDKVKILKPMINYTEGGYLQNTVGKIEPITERYVNPVGEKKIRIGSWWYSDIEGETYELVEPKGSINPEPVKPESPKPTRRILNADV